MIGREAGRSALASLNRVLAGNVDERGFVTNEHRYLAIAQRLPERARPLSSGQHVT